MKLKNPHWSFYAEILSRSLKDLETICSANPESNEFQFLREESSEIVIEAREALSALEAFLRAYDSSHSTTDPKPTHH